VKRDADEAKLMHFVARMGRRWKRRISLLEIQTFFDFPLSRNLDDKVIKIFVALFI